MFYGLFVGGGEYKARKGQYVITGMCHLMFSTLGGGGAALLVGGGPWGGGGESALHVGYVLVESSPPCAKAFPPGMADRPPPYSRVYPLPRQTPFSQCKSPSRVRWPPAKAFLTPPPPTQNPYSPFQPLPIGTSYSICQLA